MDAGVRADTCRAERDRPAAPEICKVCILTETYYPEVAGGETQARTLAESLVERGCSVTVITRRSGSSLPRVERMGRSTTTV